MISMIDGGPARTRTWDHEFPFPVRGRCRGERNDVDGLMGAWWNWFPGMPRPGEFESRGRQRRRCAAEIGRRVACGVAVSLAAFDLAQCIGHDLVVKFAPA